MAVVGGCGGAGASTLAAALATVAATDGVPAMLVDTDRWGGGLDVLLGAEDDPGLRWADLSGLAGPVDPRRLRAALPRTAGVTLLTHGRGRCPPVRPDVVRDVLRAAARGHGLVVVDAARPADAAGAAVLECVAATVVVVPARVRAVAAAGVVVAAARERCPDLRLLVRASPPGSLPARTVAEVLGVPLTGCLPAVSGLDRAAELGRGPAAGRRSPLTRVARHLVAGLLDDPAAAPARSAG